MSIAPEFVGSTRAYTYKLTVPPAGDAVLFATLKEHMKVTGTADDVLIQLYLDAATKYAEKLMRKDLITHTYETFRDFFPGTVSRSATFGLVALVNNGNIGFELRRSPLQSVTSVEYLPQSTPTVFTPIASTVFYNTVETDYSELLTLDGQSWPNDAARRLQAIKITFKTGFGDTEADVPEDIQNAIMEHVLALYQNRGDCDTASCTPGQCSSALPAAARMTYLQYRIENL